MSFFVLFFLFFFGAIFGSFLNVVALRYRADRFVFSPRVIGGRSCCTSCRRVLSWYELVPVFSFCILRGTCRTCHATLSPQYVLTELINGVLFVSIPWFLSTSTATAYGHDSFLLVSIFWIIVFEILFLITLIDIRLYIIPDELTVALLLLGVFFCWWFLLPMPPDSFALFSSFSPYALVFGFSQSLFINRLVALCSLGGLFLFIYVITRGQGIGFGDVKLSIAIALLFGWPDALLIGAFSFVIGAGFGLFQMVRHRASLRSSIAFGPFLALATLLSFFFGGTLLSSYFSLFGII
jgi:prepilin signal peptidase PulO-like enzyme (type II secretory pathway)